MRNILCVIFRTVILVFIGVSCNNVSVAVSSGLPLVSPVYLGIEMIRSRKSFLKFDCPLDFTFRIYLMTLLEKLLVMVLRLIGVKNSDFILWITSSYFLNA